MNNEEKKLKQAKKILFVSRPLSPPWDEASKNLAFFLAKNIRRFSLTVMVRDFLSDFSENVSQAKVYKTSEIRNFGIAEKLRSLFFQWKSRNNFDIHHYFFTPTRLNTFLIKKLLVSEKTKTIQTVATLREDLWSDADLKKLMFADEIITYSDYSKKRLEKLGFSNVNKIYPGIDLELYRKENKDQALLSELGISENDFVLVFPGEYVRLGAVDLIVEAFREVQKTIPASKLVLACRIKNEGDRKKQAEISDKIQAQRISEKVIFVDTFSEMRKIYNLSDVILFPVSDMKGKFDVPLVIPEAQACEKPVVVSDLPIFREFANESNSVIIRKGNQEDLIVAIVDLFKNPEKRKVIGEKGAVFARENFDIKKVAQKYENIYEKI